MKAARRKDRTIAAVNESCVIMSDSERLQDRLKKGVRPGDDGRYAEERSCREG